MRALGIGWTGKVSGVSRVGKVWTYVELVRMLLDISHWTGTVSRVFARFKVESPVLQRY